MTLRRPGEHGTPAQDVRTGAAFGIIGPGLSGAPTAAMVPDTQPDAVTPGAGDKPTRSKGPAQAAPSPPASITSEPLTSKHGS